MRLRSLAFLMLALPGALHAQADTLLLRAQQAYASGDYGQALALYDSVHATQTSDALLFNIGNCYAKLGDLPRSILYYERALRLAPGAEDIQANLDLQRAKLVDRMATAPAFTLRSAWDSLIGGADPDQWARRSLWACGIMAVLAAAALATRQRAGRRVLFIASGAALFVTVLSVALAAYRMNEVTGRHEAIIMRPSAEVLGEPRSGSTRLFLLHQGTKINVVGEQDDWLEVRLPNGSVGWMPAAAVERI